MARLSRLLILGGLAAGAVYARRNQQQVKGLVDKATPGPSTSPRAPRRRRPARPRPPRASPRPRPAPAPAPAVANLDVAGPPENTATHVPAAEPVVHEPAGGIDEAPRRPPPRPRPPTSAGRPSTTPTSTTRAWRPTRRCGPLEEAGEGWNEGQELAEADLVENAEPAAGDPIEAERQIDEVIEAQDDPNSGESDEVIEQLGLADEAETEVEAEALGDVPPPPSGDPVTDVPPPPSAEEKSSAVWRLEDQPTVEADAVDEDGPARTQDGS